MHLEPFVIHSALPARPQSLVRSLQLVEVWPYLEERMKVFVHNPHDKSYVFIIFFMCSNGQQAYVCLISISVVCVVRRNNKWMNEWNISQIFLQTQNKRRHVTMTERRPTDVVLICKFNIKTLTSTLSDFSTWTQHVCASTTSSSRMFDKNFQSCWPTVSISYELQRMLHYTQAISSSVISLLALQCPSYINRDCLWNAQ